MQEIIPFDWHRLLIGETPILFVGEILLRILAVYLFAVVMVRFIGKRGKRQMTPFSYLVLICMGSAVGDAMFYAEIPLLYAFFVIAAITVLTLILERVQFLSHYSRQAVNGTARLIIEDGVLDEEVQSRENLSDEQLYSMLREAGVSDMSEVDHAYVELSGQLSVFRKGEMAGRKRGLFKKRAL